jgi:hypothetical protein
LVQGAHHEDQSHHVFDAELLHGLLNHRALANLHVCAENLDQTACEVHLQMDDAHQNELDALLALDYLRDVKGATGAVLYLPSFLTPSRFLIF